WADRGAPGSGAGGTREGGPTLPGHLSFGRRRPPHRARLVPNGALLSSSQFLSAAAAVPCGSALKRTAASDEKNTKRRPLEMSQFCGLASTLIPLDIAMAHEPANCGVKRSGSARKTVMCWAETKR